MRTVWPAFTRVLAFARAPSTRISPVRHAFSIWPCVRPWNLRFSQRSRRVSSSSASTREIDDLSDVPAHPKTRFAIIMPMATATRPASTEPMEYVEAPTQSLRSIMRIVSSEYAEKVVKPPSTPTPRNRRHCSPALAARRQPAGKHADQQAAAHIDRRTSPHGHASARAGMASETPKRPAAPRPPPRATRRTLSIAAPSIGPSWPRRPDRQAFPCPAADRTARKSAGGGALSTIRPPAVGCGRSSLAAWSIRRGTGSPFRVAAPP